MLLVSVPYLTILNDACISGPNNDIIRGVRRLRNVKPSTGNVALFLLKAPIQIHVAPHMFARSVLLYAYDGVLAQLVRAFIKNILYKLTRDNILFEARIVR